MAAVNDHQDIKREKILEASYQRFLHYGYSKTTMNEIAGDLSMSKALLYYYFPDKSQLYIAVMRKLANEYIKSLEDNTDTLASLKDAFVYQIDTNHEFIVSNYNFFDFFRLNEQNLPDMIWEIVDQVHLAELNLLSQALKSEIEAGTIKPVPNPDELINLLLDALHGIRDGSVSQKKVSFPKKEHLEAIHLKKLLLIDIFIKGLRY